MRARVARLRIFYVVVCNVLTVLCRVVHKHCALTRSKNIWTKHVFPRLAHLASTILSQSNKRLINDVFLESTYVYFNELTFNGLKVEKCIVIYCQV